MWITSDEYNIIQAAEPYPAGYINTVTSCWPCQVVKLAKYDSMVAIVSLVPSTTVIYLNEYAALTPSGAGAAIAMPSTRATYRLSAARTVAAGTVTGIDALGARTAVPSTGISVTLATTSGVNYIIELKSADLDVGYPYVAISVSTSATAACGLCVNYIMKPRYPQLDMSTAIS